MQMNFGFTLDEKLSRNNVLMCQKGQIYKSTTHTICKMAFCRTQRHNSAMPNAY